MSVTFSTGCGTGASRICTKGQMSAMCSKKCRSSPTFGPAAHPDRVAGNRPGGEVLPGLRREVQLIPLSRPCPSSVLVRSGACTRTGPFAPTASCGVGAPSCGGPRPHWQVRGRSWQQLETQTKKRGPHTGVVLRSSGGGGGGGRGEGEGDCTTGTSTAKCTATGGIARISCIFWAMGKPQRHDGEVNVLEEELQLRNLQTVCTVWTATPVVEPRQACP